MLKSDACVDELPHGDADAHCDMLDDSDGDPDTLAHHVLTALELDDAHALVDTLVVSDGLRVVLSDTHVDAAPDTVRDTCDVSLVDAREDALTVMSALTDSDRADDALTDAVAIDDDSGVCVAID